MPFQLQAPPLPGLSPQADTGASAQRSAQELARQILERHRRALQSRRPIELTWEKNLLWLDGEGDNQWADIKDGQRVAIPRTINEYRVSHNLLRPIVDNAVAYHCTKPLKFVVESRRDSQAKQQAIIDAAVVNFICRDQHVNGHLAQAMYLAMVAGFCPVHAAWREDAQYAPYEPLYLAPEEVEGMRMPRKGVVSVWVGNPFDHTFSVGDKRGSITGQRYGRVVSAESVRQQFGVDIEGSKRQPSASLFQRVLRNWRFWELNQHSSAAMQGGGPGEEDLIALICEEVPPGIEADYPMGRQSLIALPGSAETHRDGGASGSNNVVHLFTQPLPAARLSSVNFYSSQRFDDVHGAPWVAPLMPLQGRLNQILSKEWEYSLRMVHAPTFVSGEVREDDLQYNGYGVITIDGQTGGTPARVMDLPGAPLTALASQKESVKQDIYTIGGYQAASRGEGQAGDPASKTMFLAQKDDTIHGPVNQMFRFSCEDFAQLLHAIFAQTADVAWLIDTVGDEFEELGETYIDKTHVSQRPPQFRVVSGFGATTDLEAQNLIQMVQLRGADNQPLLPTEQFRSKYPDQSLYDQRSDPAAAQVRRARLGNSIIRKEAAALRQQIQQQVPEGSPEVAITMSDPATMMAGYQLVQTLAQSFPLLPTDDPAAHMAALMELTQDETEDPIARQGAVLRYQLYQQWQAQLAAWSAAQQGATQMAAQGQQPAQQPRQGGTPAEAQSAAETEQQPEMEMAA